MEDLISVIVPVYNVEKYLDRCIESIVNQTYQNLEILLIDDGSTDNSGKMCDEWAKKDARLKVVHKENQGVSTARNVGLAEATGKYIGFVDSDDYIEKDMYEIMHKELKKSKIDLVICDFHKIGLKNTSNKEETDNKYSVEMLDKFQALEKFYPLSGAIWKCLFKKEILKDMNFDITMYTGEDLKFICEYILNCENNSLFIKKGLYNCVQRKDSVTRLNTAKEKRLRFQIDTLEAIKQARLLIMEKCDKIEVRAKIENRTIFAYWVIIYAILDEKLGDYKLIRKYYDELKEYKQYYSKKDKFYWYLLGISSKLFEVMYRNVKRLNHWRKVIGVK